MVPSWLQLPPRKAVGSAVTVTGAPPAISIFFKAPSAEKAMKRLSGDQNGRDARLVPGNACADNESRRRIHNGTVLSFALAAKTIQRPSGERTGPAIVKSSNVVSPGAMIDVVISGVLGTGRLIATHNATAAPAAAAPAISHGSHRRVADTFAGAAAVASGVAPPDAIHSSSARRSRAVCQRSSGSFARQRFTARSSVDGVSGARSFI